VISSLGTNLRFFLPRDLPCRGWPERHLQHGYL